MAIPTDVATLYAWYKAGSLSLNEGDQVTTWLDSSGNGRTMTGATAVTYKPFYRSNQLAGYPAVELNGTNQDYFTHDTFGWLANLASCTLFMVWKGTSAGTGGIITSEGGGWSECLFQKSATQVGRRWSSTTTAYEALATCNLGEWHYVCGFQSGASQIGVSVDGGSETTTALAGSRDTGVTTKGRLGLDNGAYAAGRLAEAIIYSSSLSAGDKTLVNNYLRDKYFAAAPGQQEQVRDALSRRLWLLRRPTGIFEVTVPLWMLDADILDRIAVESRVGPAPLAAGWGGKKWQRRAFSIQRISDVNPATNTVKLQLLDRRPLDVLFWDAARTDKRNSGARQDGVARIIKSSGVGAEAKFTRPSKAWIENPADPTSVVECAQAERAINQTGEYLEEKRTNLIARSSGVSGTTGLSIFGAGTNGSSITADTTDLLFGSETSPSSLKFTAGTPHTAHLYLVWSTATISASSEVRVSLDYKIDNGESFYWQLVRSSGATTYWDDANGVWTAGTTNTNLPAVNPRSAASRFISKKINVGLVDVTLTLYLFQWSGGTSGRISHLYHAQVEVGAFATSRIVTDGAAVTRERSELSHPVTTAAKIYDPALGTFFCEFTPEWSSADLATGYANVFFATTNGGADYDVLYYSFASGQWAFSRRVGGSTYSAILTASMTRGTAVRLAACWTGVEGELSLSAYTVSVFVNGTKGTDATAVAATFASPETLYRGSNSSLASHANGAIRSVHIFPYALTDEEIARLP